MDLSDQDRASLEGDNGEAARLAMRILLKMAQAMGAEKLIDIRSAHIDGCLYHGQASLDFVQRMVDGGGQVAVPTTLNVGSIDLLHPELFRGDAGLAAAGRRLMQAHLALGCQATFTCAPYQLRRRPAFGEQIAWAESNAIVFANSVLGARTERYGDFIDLCAALTGRAPYCGLHTDAGRRGRLVFELRGFPESPCRSDAFYTALGLYIGKHAGSRVPVIVGLPPDSNEDQLKALGSAAASGGAVALFHAVGVTPEAATLNDALHGQAADQIFKVSPQDLRAALARLDSASNGPLRAVCLGTPHFSLSEFERLLAALARCPGPAKVGFYINTARATQAELQRRGDLQRLRDAGIQLVVDTCTYLTPILQRLDGVVMTNSGKWAYYAPGNIGARVAFGDLEDCVKSAMTGTLCRDDDFWHGTARGHALPR